VKPIVKPAEFVVIVEPDTIVKPQAPVVKPTVKQPIVKPIVQKETSRVSEPSPELSKAIEFV